MLIYSVVYVHYFFVTYYDNTSINIITICYKQTNMDKIL